MSVKRRLTGLWSPPPGDGRSFPYLSKCSLVMGSSLLGTDVRYVCSLYGVFGVFVLFYGLPPFCRSQFFIAHMHLQLSHTHTVQKVSMQFSPQIVCLQKFLNNSFKVHVKTCWDFTRTTENLDSSGSRRHLMMTTTMMFREPTCGTSSVSDGDSATH